MRRRADLYRRQTILALRGLGSISFQRQFRPRARLMMTSCSSRLQGRSGNVSRLCAECCPKRKPAFGSTR